MKVVAEDEMTMRSAAPADDEDLIPKQFDPIKTLKDIFNENKHSTVRAPLSTNHIINKYKQKHRTQRRRFGETFGQTFESNMMMQSQQYPQLNQVAKVYQEDFGERSEPIMVKDVTVRERLDKLKKLFEEDNVNRQVD